MKKFFTVKKVILTAILIVVITATFLLFSGSNDSLVDVEFQTVARGDVKEMVSETGFVQPSREIAMAFERGGRVISVPVTVGDKVEEGDVLIELDPAERKAELVGAYARLRAEQVRLNELLKGADNISLGVSGASVVSAETALDNAKAALRNITTQQDLLVANAKKTLLSSGLQAYITSDGREGTSYSYAAPVVSGTYTSDQEGIYIIELYRSGASSGSSYRVSGLETATESVSTVGPTSIGTRGLYIQFPNNFAPNTEWEIPIPNTRSSAYISYQNAYKSAVEARDVAIKTAENAVKSAEAALGQSNQLYTQVSSSARDERVEAQQAMVSQMSALVQTAELAVEKTTLKAPFTGIVTSLNIQEGEIVSPLAPVVSLISDDNFELVVNISESEIQDITVDDTAEVRFDAYDDAIFGAHVLRISPTASIVGGVRVFEVTLKFDEKDIRIRSGLSADIDILAEQKNNVITVPTRSIVEREDGKFVRTWDGRKLSYIPVKTGLRGSGGVTEIINGLTEGTEIISFAREETLSKLEAKK